jgi:hypothetical protein
MIRVRVAMYGPEFEATIRGPQVIAPDATEEQREDFQRLLEGADHFTSRHFLPSDELTLRRIAALQKRLDITIAVLAHEPDKHVRIE